MNGQFRKFKNFQHSHFNKSNFESLKQSLFAIHVFFKSMSEHLI